MELSDWFKGFEKGIAKILVKKDVPIFHDIPIRFFYFLALPLEII